MFLVISQTACTVVFVNQMMTNDILLFGCHSWCIWLEGAYLCSRVLESFIPMQTGSGWPRAVASPSGASRCSRAERSCHCSRGQIKQGVNARSFPSQGTPINQASVCLSNKRLCGAKSETAAVLIPTPVCSAICRSSLESCVMKLTWCQRDRCCPQTISELNTNELHSVYLILWYASIFLTWLDDCWEFWLLPVRLFLLLLLLSFYVEFWFYLWHSAAPHRSLLVLQIAETFVLCRLVHYTIKSEGKTMLVDLVFFTNCLHFKYCFKDYRYIKRAMCASHWRPAPMWFKNKLWFLNIQDNVWCSWQNCQHAQNRVHEWKGK